MGSFHEDWAHYKPQYATVLVARNSRQWAPDLGKPISCIPLHITPASIYCSVSFPFDSPLWGTILNFWKPSTLYYIPIYQHRNLSSNLASSKDTWLTHNYPKPKPYTCLMKPVLGGSPAFSQYTYNRYDIYSKPGYPHKQPTPDPPSSP